MNRPATLLRGASIGFALFVALFARGEELPLPFEFRHVHVGEMRLNLQSPAGVPISITPGDPPGSNGQEPRDNESAGSTSTAATVRQMQSLMSPGGVVPNRTNVAYIHQGTEEPTLILRRAVIGMPYYSKQSAVAFGDIIAPPLTDEYGVPLPIGSVYWQGEPYSWYGHEAAGASSTNGYYWSPHARLVYAHQTGRVRITWIASQPYTAANKPDWTNNLWDKGATADADGHYLKRGRNYYKLYTVQYQVAGYPAKPTRKIYWTEKGFFAGSTPIRVPEGAVGKVNFLYNKQVPEFVEQEFKDIGQSSPADGNTDTNGVAISQLRELHTVWWDAVQKVLRAYNRGASGRDTATIDEQTYGTDHGIRVAYGFTADAPQRVISITPVDPRTPWHFYGLALNAAPARLAVEHPEGGKVADGSEIEAGRRGIGAEPAEITLVLRNAGVVPLRDLRFKCEGPQAGDFRVVAPALPAEEGAKVPLNVKVQFAPAAEGPRSARLEIFSNDPRPAPFTIHLAGTGLPPVGGREANSPSRGIDGR